MLVSVDTETRRFRQGLWAPKLICLSYSAYDGKTGLVDAKGALRVVRSLHDECCRIVGQNFVYDAVVLCAEYPELIPVFFEMYEQGRVECTKINEQLIHIALGIKPAKGNKKVAGALSLAGMSKKYLGKDLAKGDETWRKRFSELEHVPIEEWPEDARAYALTDAIRTFEVRDGQHAFVKATPEVFTEGYLPNVKEQNQAAFALQLMKVWGIRTDKEEVERLGGIWSVAYEEGRKRLREAGLLRITGSKKKPKESLDQKALRARVKEVYESQGRPVPLTPKGAIKVDSKRTLPESNDPLLLAIAEGAEIQKLYTSFLPVLRQGVEYPLCPDWNPLVATGRISCRNPNLTQIPRGFDVRSAFVPRRGFKFIGGDYNGAELRSFAQICLDWFGFSQYAELFQQGLDVHVHFAASMSHRTYDQMLEALEQKEGKKLRQFAKEWNYGKIGGMGAARFVEQATKAGLLTQLSASGNYQEAVGVAKNLDRVWRGTFPEVVLYLNKIARDVGHDTMTIRQVQSGRIRGDVGYSDGANGYFQSLTADGVKDALFQTSFECYVDKHSALYGSRPVLDEHDEIVCEAPDAKASDAAERLVVIMEKSMRKYLRDVPVVVEPWYSARWFKEAKTVRNGAGKLVEWVKG